MASRTEMTGLGIQYLENGIRVLTVIGAADEALSIGDIADRCGMSKSLLHRYLTSLHRTGFIRRDEDLRYSVGPAAMTLGLNAVRRFDIGGAARNGLLRLRERLNETVALSIWTGNGPHYLQWVESQRAVNVGIRVGVQVSALKSAGGKVFLAFLDEEETRYVAERECREFGVSLTEFQQEMNRIRRQGYATTVESLLPGIVSAAAPVFGRGGTVMAAVTVVGILGQLNVDKDSPVVEELKRTCSEISQSFGYNPAAQA
ncbi:MAG: IclR family transcriptional regulator [Alicyclobacillus macrosporangiidus]|uniref:IclR family transcriptional regulator n=1 Tax=Alicyclobacillus macrosporangiidus TaxID=392015 RepID=UPI0026F1192D|nr:IclR family transcriptional regulator [Alicyclobacillus macrosporangiidus]MCL6599712.1 IclR family transcriptional regulator [Alicyclobacillus macrosporangiidus]